MNNKKLDPLDEWMLDVLSGAAGSGRRKELEALLNADPAAARRFEEFKQSWQALGRMEEETMQKLESEAKLQGKVMRAVKEELHREQRRFAKHDAARAAPYWRWVSWGVAAAMLLMAAAIIYLAPPKDKNEQPPVAQKEKKGNKTSENDQGKRIATPTPTLDALTGVALRSPCEEEILKKLQQKVSFEFRDTPLVEAVAFIQSVADISIVVDPKVRKANWPISLKVSNLKADLALSWITKLADTSWELRDCAVYIHKKRGLSQTSKFKLETPRAVPPALLQTHVSFEFEDTPLDDAVAFLDAAARKHGLRVSRYQTASPRRPESPAHTITAVITHFISLRVVDMSLWDAIQWVARLSGLEVETNARGARLVPNRSPRPLTLPRTAALPERLATRVSVPLRAETELLRRDALFRLVAHDTGIAIETRDLPPKLAREEVSIPSGSFTVAQLLAHAIAGARPPLKIERKGDGLRVRPLAIQNERLDRKLPDPMAKSLAHTVRYLVEHPAPQANQEGQKKIFYWLADGLRLKRVRFEGKSSFLAGKAPANFLGLTYRQALEGLCRAARLKYSIQGETLLLTPDVATPKTEDF